MNPKIETTEQRVNQLYDTRWKDIPELAVDFAHYYAEKYGFCGETCINAFSAYAQLVEGLPCTNPDYEINPNDKKNLISLIPQEMKTKLVTKKQTPPVNQEHIDEKTRD